MNAQQFLEHWEQGEAAENRRRSSGSLKRGVMRLRRAHWWCGACNWHGKTEDSIGANESGKLCGNELPIFSKSSWSKTGWSRYDFFSKSGLVFISYDSFAFVISECFPWKQKAR